MSFFWFHSGNLLAKLLFILYTGIMKILLIEALKHKSITSSIYPPLGLYYIESFVKKHVPFPVEFSNISASDTSKADLWDAPQIIGISSVTANFTVAVKIASELRSRLGNEVPIILGGCHISALPGSLPPPFDAAVIGEGEVTFLEILRKLYDKGRLKPGDFRDIDGVAYMDEGKIIINKERTFIANLDEIPFPARRLAGIGVTHMLTSRGCPYSCVYCATCHLWGKVRSHSPEYVVREIRHLHDGFNINEIILFDDNFLADRKRVHEISDKISSGGLKGKLSFICYGRTRAINESLVNDLVNMGVSEIYLGADNVPDSVIDGSGSSHAYERNSRAVDLCYDAGLKVNCSFVIGLPRQTTKDLDEILRFMDYKRDRVSVFQISPLNLFPGTPVWEYAVKQGKIPESVEDWNLLEHFTPIGAFSAEKYIFLNEMMSINEFAGYCKRFTEI